MDEPGAKGRSIGTKVNEKVALGTRLNVVTMTTKDWTVERVEPGNVKVSVSQKNVFGKVTEI